MLDPIVTSIRHCAASWGCLLAMYSSSAALITLSLMAADKQLGQGVKTHIFSLIQHEYWLTCKSKDIWQ